MVTLNLALYEVANSLWKHQHILKDLDDGIPYLIVLLGLMDAGTIMVVHPNEDIMRRSYLVATKSGIPVHDAIFVALALELELQLKTFDKRQNRIMRLNASKDLT
jgi:predicted nucleic acid-binding protein